MLFFADARGRFFLGAAWQIEQTVERLPGERAQPGWSLLHRGQDRVSFFLAIEPTTKPERRRNRFVGGCQAKNWGLLPNRPQGRP